jgi:hypothetical protein
MIFDFCSILIHPSCLNRGSDGAMGEKLQIAKRKFDNSGQNYVHLLQCTNLKKNAIFSRRLHYPR